MPWDPFAPTQAAPSRESLTSEPAVPLGVPYEVLGAWSGVGTDQPSTPATSTPGSDVPPPPPPPLAREVLRLGAISAVRQYVALPAGARALTVYNPLHAPIYITWGTGGSQPTRNPTTPTDADVAVPGDALASVPVPTEATGLAAAAVYAGAVPGTDTGYYAVLTATTDPLGLFVGPLT